MKILFLFLALLFSSLCLADQATPQLFIMLDVDNTLTDKISVSNNIVNNEYAGELVKKGFTVQPLEFYSIKGQDSMFDHYKNNKKSRDLIVAESEEKLKISQMIAIRPAMQDFLEKLTSLKIPVHIIICSRSSNARVQNLIENLELKINGKPFKEVVDFAPREQFRVEIKSAKGRKAIAKSAWELRQTYAGKFGKIKDHDYVVLIDQLPDNRFIYSNPHKDLNIYIKPFYIKKENMLDLNEDKKDMDIIIEKIKKFAR